MKTYLSHYTWANKPGATARDLITYREFASPMDAFNNAITEATRMGATLLECRECVPADHEW